MEPAVARTGRLDKIRNLLDEIRRYYDKIMVKVSNRLVTACRLTSVTRPHAGSTPVVRPSGYDYNETMKDQTIFYSFLVTRIYLLHIFFSFHKFFFL